MKVKKLKLLSLIFVMLLVFLSACSGGSQGAKGTNGKKMVELTWMFWAGQGDRPQWEALAKKVTEKYPNIKVNMQVYDWNTYWTKLKTQIASGNTADIVGMQSAQLPVYAEKGIFEPLNSYIDTSKNLNYSDFNKAITDGMTYDGKTYALPYDYGAFTLLYNKELFKKYHVPLPDEKMTWEGFLDRAKKLTHREKKEYGFAFPDHIWDSTPWIWQMNGDWLKGNGDYKINSPETIKAFKFLSDLVNKYKVAPTAGELSAIGYDEQFSSGKIGMIIDGPWTIQGYKKYEKPGKLDIGVQVMPKAPTGRNVSFVAGSGLAVSAKSKHKKEAFKAISVITNSESLKYLAKNGRAYPARDSAVEAFNKYNKDIDNISAFHKQALNSKAYKTSPKYAEAEEIINQGLEPIFYGKENVKTALNKIQRKLDELNKE
ncbi:carbohydrate ABC transporter substrate-binding protein (CUT1 family) [Scopulibacillus darangshiensis]|uniref:Carbohydrate ABC transporter substrate-binding protein (CUT1 family) n=1 Tax=Scopulibacillus darangshiensis TaxID=442528 RepID=A0A4R2P6M4_9BACL|nr:sugar ABC transporter substrate-binding protein [Scopulibacillus darangshiensis]TCP29641.1 carbohydrate ABC transporter substrate-binding protein (CUT1 family) [Scopulibacillus darangshiensis]